MKVAFFLGSLNRGGTETLVLDTLRGQSSAPFESILIYRNDGDLTEEYQLTGVKMFRVKPNRTRIGGYINQLRKILKREKVDVIHTQTLLNALLGLFCVCFSHVRLVASFHGLFTSFMRCVSSHIVLWFADASVFVSGYEMEWYFRHTIFAPRKRCHVVCNGIDCNKLLQRYPVPDFLEKGCSAKPGNCVRLAMVGNFGRGRSQFFLCKCLKRLTENGSRCFQFFFVGKRSLSEPERYDECVRYCQENGLSDSVVFLGSRSDVPAILQYMDGFVYASENDSFGIAVVEAMVAGLPVIVNDWDVMKEITNNGQWATLYKTNDVKDCVSKIEELIEHVSSWKRKAESTVEAVMQRFSIGSHIENLNRVYEASCI